MDLVIGNFTRAALESLALIPEWDVQTRKRAMAQLARFAIPEWLVIWKNEGPVSSPGSDGCR